MSDPEEDLGSAAGDFGSAAESRQRESDATAEMVARREAEEGALRAPHGAAPGAASSRGPAAPVILRLMITRGVNIIRSLSLGWVVSDPTFGSSNSRAGFNCKSIRS